MMTITNQDIKQHEKLVDSLLKSFLSNQKVDSLLDVQEYKQVGLIAVHRALQLYDKNKGNFKSYIITAIKRAFAKQRQFDTKSINDYSDDVLFNIEDTHTRDMDFRIDTEILLKALKYVRMDKKNKLMIIDKMKGYTVPQLRKKYNISSNRIYQLINRFKNKIEELQNDNRE